MKKLILNLIVVCLATTLFAFICDSTKELAGIWNFSINDAPDGYNKGNIEFTETEGTLQGKMVTENGTFPMENLKVSNDSITYDLKVQSAVLQALLIKVKDSLSGKIITPEGDLMITGKKQTTK